MPNIVQFNECLLHNLTPDAMTVFDNLVKIYMSNNIYLNFDFIRILSDSLSSLTLTNYKKWAKVKICGICSNVCSILEANNSVKLIKVRPFVYAIISKLSFLFYHNNNVCHIDGWCGLPIPKVSSSRWQGDELEMRVKYANWLSTQLNLYLKTQGGEI